MNESKPINFPQFPQWPLFYTRLHRSELIFEIKANCMLYGCFAETRPWCQSKDSRINFVMGSKVENISVKLVDQCSNWHLKRMSQLSAYEWEIVSIEKWQINLSAVVGDVISWHSKLSDPGSCFLGCMYSGQSSEPQHDHTRTQQLDTYRWPLQRKSCVSTWIHNFTVIAKHLTHLNITNVAWFHTYMDSWKFVI